MIRKAKYQDLKEIIRLSKESLNNSFSEESLRKMIDEEETYYIFVKEINGLVGFIIIWISDNNGQIIDIVINESKRMLGYGKGLLKYSLNYFKENKVNTVSLEVRKSNLLAIKFYEKFDFKIEKTINNYYQNEDGLLMMRSL